MAHHCFKKSKLPDRITLDIGEELLIMPDEIQYPIQRRIGTKESKGIIKPGQYNKYPNPVYLPNPIGPIKRVKFAIINFPGP